MAKKFNWSITLRPNAFTPDNDRDQLADVVPAGTKKDEDIADEIVAEESEIKKETILNILSLCNKKVMAYALAGYNYSNEVEQMTPRVNGVFEDINAQFDPNIHKCVIDITAGAAQNMQGRRFAYCGTRALRHIAVPPPCLRYSRPRQSAILTA